MQDSPEIIALLTEVRDLLREQGERYREMAARSVAQQEVGIAMARRAQRVLAPLLGFVVLVLIAVVVWLYVLLNR